MNLEIMPWSLSVCRLDAGERIPKWATKGAFFTVSRTPEELSVVCETASVEKPSAAKVEAGWSCLKVSGTLDFGLTGILASLVTPLAQDKISVFAISTFDTDYLLVREENLDRAIDSLRRAGHQVNKR